MVSFCISPADNPQHSFLITSAFTAEQLGLDQPHLFIPIKRARLGSPRGPVALKTRLGWTLHSPNRLEQSIRLQQCLLISTIPQMSDLFRNVEKLWQADILAFRNEKEVTRS